MNTITIIASCVLLAAAACTGGDEDNDRSDALRDGAAAASGGTGASAGNSGSAGTPICTAVDTTTCAEEPDVQGVECCAVTGRVLDPQRGCAAIVLMGCAHQQICGGDAGVGCYSRNLADGGVQLYQTPSTYAEIQDQLLELGFTPCDEATANAVMQWELCP